MKRITALLLACVMAFTGCSSANTNDKEAADNIISIEEDKVSKTDSVAEDSNNEEEKDSEIEVSTQTETENENNIEVEPLEFHTEYPQDLNLNDEELLRFVEDNIYTELVKELDSEEYFVENVSAVYVSNEYIEELEYNSQSNIYFGFTLEELDEEFQGTRYVFTLGDDGTTVVKPFEEYDDSYERVIKNVAVGTGVILICVTVSAVTAGAGAPAVGMIFAAAAKTGTTFALSSGTISFAAAAITTGIETGNVEEALKAGAVTGSEAFKWGAITGAISGGGGATVKYTKAMQALKGVPLNGLTTQQAAAIQMESGYPVSIIKQFHSMDEYKIYKDAGLSAKIINNELALVRDIDLNYKYPGETMNNLERMKQGLAPYDPKTGKLFQLHHIGQKSDATLAILNEAEHQGNSAILNFVDKASEIDRDAFAPIRKKFWKSFAASVTKI